SPARAVFQFALATLAAVALVGFLASRAIQHQTNDEAINEAKQLTRLAGRGIAERSLTPGLYTYQKGSQRRVAHALVGTALAEPVVRIKIWTADGHILWSDVRQLIGKHFDLDPQELRALHSGRTDAEISDLTEPENHFERNFEKLLEVYLPI